MAHPCSSLQSVLHLTSYPQNLVLAPFPGRPKRSTLGLGSPRLVQQAEPELQRRRAPAPGLEDEEEARHPAGCKVPKQILHPRSESHWGLEKQKVGEGTIKLRGRMEKCHGRAGRWGPDQVPAGVGSPGASGWLGSATPPARAAGIRPHRAAPRPPPQRQESGLARTGRRVRGSRPAGAGCLERRAGPGGASLSVNALLLSAPPAAWRPALRQGSPRPRARRSRMDRCKLRGSHGEPHARMVGPRHSSAGLASRPRPKCRVTSSGVSRPAPEGDQGHVPRLPPCALRGENRNPEKENDLSRGLSKMRLESRVQSNTLQNCQGFLELSRGRNLFYNKVRRRKRPPSCHCLPPPAP